MKFTTAAQIIIYCWAMLIAAINQSGVTCAIGVLIGIDAIYRIKQEKINDR